MSKRRFFQYHLSTAVVLMFVAAGLLWLNAIELAIGSGRWITIRGWPCYFIVVVEYGGGVRDWSVDYGALAIDIFTAMAILATALFACEWRIRRKAG